MRVFVDTTVLISAFATAVSALTCPVVAEHELLTGEVILTEFRRVLRERSRVPPAKIALVEDQLSAHTIIARPAAPSNLRLRDASEAWVLAPAVAGGAELLVTGDKDLLRVAPGGAAADRGFAALPGPPMPSAVLVALPA